MRTRTNYTISSKNYFYKTIITLLCFIFLFTSILCLTGFKKKNPTDIPVKKYYTSITIQDGDTLWSIAEENTTEEYCSIKKYIEEVKTMNHLTSDTITEGRHIVIPHYANNK